MKKIRVSGFAVFLFFFLAACGEGESIRETENFIFHFEAQDAGAIDDLADALEGNFERITSILGIRPDSRTDVFVYPSLEVFHQAVGQLFAPEWYAGTAINGIIHMVSPIYPNLIHDYDVMIKIVVYELVHVVAEQLTYVHRPFLSEGLALYLSGQNDSVESAIAYGLETSSIPMSERMFSRIWDERVYQVGYALIEFIAAEFGYNELAHMYIDPHAHLDYLGISHAEFDERWIDFLIYTYGSQ